MAGRQISLSHPLLILRDMTETLICTGVLVVHADGTNACDHVEHCGAEELAHEWWVSCDELGCGCVGEEHAPPALLLAA